MSRMMEAWKKHRKDGESFREFSNRTVREAAEKLLGEDVVPEEKFNEGDKFFIVTKAESTRYPTQEIAEQKAAEFIDKYKHESYFVLEAVTLVKRKPTPTDSKTLAPIAEDRVTALVPKDAVPPNSYKAKPSSPDDDEDFD